MITLTTIQTAATNFNSVLELVQHFQNQQCCKILVQTISKVIIEQQSGYNGTKILIYETDKTPPTTNQMMDVV